MTNILQMFWAYKGLSSHIFIPLSSVCIFFSFFLIVLLLSICIRMWNFDLYTHDTQTHEHTNNNNINNKVKGELGAYNSRDLCGLLWMFRDLINSLINVYYYHTKQRRKKIFRYNENERKCEKIFSCDSYRNNFLCKNVEKHNFWFF